MYMNNGTKKPNGELVNVKDLEVGMEVLHRDDFCIVTSVRSDHVTLTIVGNDCLLTNRQWAVPLN